MWEESDCEWSDSFGSDGHHGPTADRLLWSANRVLHQIDHKMIYIGGEPRRVAARSFKSGFIRLWVQTKNGELGIFKMEKVRNALRDGLAEHVHEFLEHYLSSLFEVKTSIEVDKSRNNSEGEDQWQVEEVKLLFRWELSDEPLRSIKDFRSWAW
jgi:hypothetical protein